MQSETTTAITAVKQDVRLREWAEQLEAQQASGLTVPQWQRGERNQDQEFLLPAAQSPGTVYPVCTGSRPADGTAAAKCRYPD